MVRKEISLPSGAFSFRRSGGIMNNYKQVDEIIEQVKNSGMSPSEMAWRVATACVGWSYVYSSWGALCTPSERQKRYRMTGNENIKKKCKNFDGDKGCTGCQWYPDKERTRCYDCRGFTDWVLKSVGIIDLTGDVCGTQWSNKANWDDKGTIDTCPDNILVCLFVYSSEKGKFTHTGLGYKGATCECSSGVQYSAKRSKMWTHWAVPKNIGYVPGSNPEPELPDGNTKPTLRRGDKGPYVTLLQTELVQRGYDIGKSGIDGDYGRATEAAVKAVQKAYGLTQDGVCGPKTWAALDGEPPVLYTVTITGLTKVQAENLISQYPGGTMTEERG